MDQPAWMASAAPQPKWMTAEHSPASAPKWMAPASPHQAASGVTQPSPAPAPEPKPLGVNQNPPINKPMLRGLVEEQGAAMGGDIDRAKGMFKEKLGEARKGYSGDVAAGVDSMKNARGPLDLLTGAARAGYGEIGKAAAVPVAGLDTLMNMFAEPSGAGVVPELAGKVEEAAKANEIVPEKTATQPGPQQLRVAAQMPDGSLRVGKPGQIHAELLGEDEAHLYDTAKMGFTDPQGKFMDRQQALDYAKQNEPLRATATARGLDAANYHGGVKENAFADLIPKRPQAPGPTLIGEAKTAAEKQALTKLPPVQDGFIRLYHGGDAPTSGGGRWVTTDPNYAANYGGEKELHYVDLPKDSPEVARAQKWETGLEHSYGAGQVGAYSHFETSPEQAAGFKPVLGGQRPARENAFADLIPKRPQAPGPLGSVTPKDASPVEPSITAYHGSPHDFDSFDLSKLGSGEGAQAYGHGFYFAERKGIAEHYASAVTEAKNKKLEQEKFKELQRKYNTDNDAIANAGLTRLWANDFDATKAKKAGADFLGRNSASEDAERYKKTVSAVDSWIDSHSDELQKYKGNLYKINIKADRDHLLDFDKRFDEQTPHVQAALKSIGLEGKSGNVLAKRLHDKFGTPEEQTAAMRAAGIPGVQYLDRSSRSKGEGTKNFVVFHPDDLEITHKNGKALPKFMQRMIAGEEAPTKELAPQPAGAAPGPLGKAAGVVGTNKDLVRQPVGAAPASTSDILGGTIADRERTAAKAPGFVAGLKSAAKTIQKIASPETVDAAAGRAAGSIRSSVGKSVRDSERTRDALASFQKQVNAYDTQDKLDILDYIQNRSAKYQPVEEVRPLMDTIRKTFEERRAKLEAAPSTERMRFQDDYFPQQWKDPNAARAFAKTFGTREGSGSFTKAKKIPTIADGIRAGLEPVTIDPIEGTLRYVENVDRFLATNEVFDTAVDNADVVWRKPGDQPQGWSEVNGRMNNKLPGQKPYAPEGWARVYNNFISKRPEGPVGDALAATQKAFNSVTAFKLGLSAFHASMMAQESVVSGVANAVSELVGLSPAKAIGSLAKAPWKPVTSALRGKQMQKAYLHDVGSPELRRIADLATEANFRVVGKGRIADEYRFSGAGNLLSAYKKGSLRAEVAALGKDISARPVAGTLKAIAQTTGRVLETISDPLFKHYIPLIKNGAFYDGMRSWLDLHPNATHEEQVAYARRMSDTIDDRFGEMNQDNIFWEKYQKMAAQIALISYSYEVGSARAFVGAARDIAKFPFTREWTPKMSYVVALPIVFGMINAIAQKLKTGKDPESPRDLLAAQTGGVDATSGQPERMTPPSYMNQLLGFYEHPLQELGNKLNPGVGLAESLVTGKDWRGDEIAKSTDSTAQVLKKYFDFVADAYTPISMEANAKKGTAISGPERFLGAKAAPMYLTDPEGYAAMQAKLKKNADKLKARHDATHERTYGGTQ